MYVSACAYSHQQPRTPRHMCSVARALSKLGRTRCARCRRSSRALAPHNPPANIALRPFKSHARSGPPRVIRSTHVSCARTRRTAAPPQRSARDQMCAEPIIRQNASTPRLWGTLTHYRGRLIWLAAKIAPTCECVSACECISMCMLCYAMYAELCSRST